MHNNIANQAHDPQTNVSLRVPQKRANPAKEFLSTLGLLLLAPIAAIIFTAFVFQFYRVDGPSMEHTLYNKDRIVVYKLPKTISKLTKHTFSPKRGEVVVFNLQEKNGLGQTESRQLIKRVIGIPGDRVVVKNGTVTVYTPDNSSGYNPDKDASYKDTAIPTIGSVDTFIEPGHVFVMGDNRSNSLDSRIFGAIESKDVVGTLAFRVLPLG